jgi:cytochrome c oxidase assembly protein subunit 11
MAEVSTPISDKQRFDRNKRVALWCVGFTLLMVGASYAAVPLYSLLCRLTGLDGTTQVSTGNLKGVIDRNMTVRFDSNVDGGLSWTVKPAAPKTDKIGTVETIIYTATNNTSKPLTGQAVFNVTPETTGLYFNKIECFCFTEQTLQPGETAEMPVTFFVDPDIAQDRTLDPIRDITLSYTFYAVPSEGS